MNERVMQFRIGMFVIVAALVLTMMIIWFGESPTLFRNFDYLSVHFLEAPGIDVGIPVRRSGIRIGEVASIKFDDRPGKGDGVLVTVALERRYRLTSGVRPRLARALIGDVSIDMLPEDTVTAPVMSETVDLSLADERIIEGGVSPDPSSALEAATLAFQQAGPTLQSIETAANGIAKLSGNTESIQEFIETWKATGQKLSRLADGAEKIVGENAESVQPTLAGIREAVERVNRTLDEPTQESVRVAARNLASGSQRLEQVLADVAPLAADLGGTYGSAPKTGVGQVVSRVDKIAYQVGLLTASLADSSGQRLNTNGTLQKLLVSTELHDNAARAATTLRELLEAMRPVVRNLLGFSERVSRDPGVIGRGALSR